jgi:hypothetical protein
LRQFAQLACMAALCGVLLLLLASAAGVVVLAIGLLSLLVTGLVLNLADWFGWRQRPR